MSQDGNRPSGQIAFKCLSVKYPLETRAAEQFKLLCELIIANYPSVMHQRAPTNPMGAYADDEASWTLVEQQHRQELHMIQAGTIDHCIGIVT